MTEPLSRFTPSMMSAAVLESVFVGREHVLNTIMRRVETAATTETRNQTLLVGPRGAGKTHLIALTYHRTKALIDQGRRLQLAWLPEDPWTIASYRHLLAAIAERLEPSPSAPGSGSVAELEARLVASAEERGTIVVLVENLDRILGQLGVDGQERFRHFLQHECRMLVIATTTNLDRNLADQARPFYGFFTTTRLAPFTPEQGRDMLMAVARHRRDDELAEFLQTEVALSRVKAIAHLAGGQPRLWALLSSSLRVQDLRTLIDLLLTRFDDLTPYYQEQLGALSQQQRLIIVELAEADHPLHVGALAERLGIDQRSVAKSISDLVERGWLAPVDTVFADLLDGRRTYYELTEPMVRLSFQIKGARGEPLRLVVDFVKAWFDPEGIDAARGEGDVETYLEVVRQEFGTDPVGCVIRQLTSLPVTRAPALALLGRVEDALAEAGRGDASEVMELPTSLRLVVEERLSVADDRHRGLIELRATLHEAALAEVGVVPTPASTEWVARAEQLVRDDGGGVSTRAMLFRWLAHTWRFDEATAALAALANSGSQIVDLNARLGNSLFAAGEFAATMHVLEQVVADRERILGPNHPRTLTSRNNLAVACQASGDLDRAIPLHEQNLADRERILGPDHRDTLTSRENLAVAYQATGDLDRAIPLHEQNLADRVRILGPDHPDTLASRNNLATAYDKSGDLDRAIALHERNFAACERVLGPDHPDTLTSRNNLATAYDKSGDLDRAIALHEKNLADRERVLGPDHPDTLASRNNLAAAYYEAGDAASATRVRRRHLVDERSTIDPEEQRGN